MSTSSPSTAHLRARAALRRRVLSRWIDHEAAAVLRTVDRRGFHEQFRDDPTLRALHNKGSSKYIYLERWMREAVERYYAFGFNRLPVGARVLDIGCGSGFFLLVCRYHGLEAVGLDLDLDPLYNRQIEFFGLERVVHRIEPGDWLPPFDRPFSLVTAFMAAFYWDLPSDVPWSSEQWRGFLPELRRVVEPGGQVLIACNRNPVTGDYLTPEVQAAITTHPAFRSQLFANCVRLRAR